MPHECRNTCDSVRYVQAETRKGTPVAQLALKLKLSESRIIELAGNYNWDSGARRKRRICDLLPFDG